MWETHTVGSDISQVFSTDRCWGPSPEATVRVAKEHRAAHVSMSLSSQPVISFSDAILHLKAVSRRVLLLPVIRLACSTVERWQILRVHYQKIDGLHITWPISQWRKGNSLWVGSFTGTQNWSVLICFSSHLSHTLIPPPGSTVSNILLHIPGILIPTEKKHKGLLEELFFQRKISLSLTKKKKMNSNLYSGKPSLSLQCILNVVTPLPSQFRRASLRPHAVFISCTFPCPQDWWHQRSLTHH